MLLSGCVFTNVHSTAAADGHRHQLDLHTCRNTSTDWNWMSSTASGSGGVAMVPSAHAQRQCVHRRAAAQASLGRQIAAAAQPRDLASGNLQRPKILLSSRYRGGDSSGAALLSWRGLGWDCCQWSHFIASASYLRHQATVDFRMALKKLAGPPLCASESHGALLLAPSAQGLVQAPVIVARVVSDWSLAIGGSCDQGPP